MVAGRGVFHHVLRPSALLGRDGLRDSHEGPGRNSLHGRAWRQKMREKTSRHIQKKERYIYIHICFAYMIYIIIFTYLHNMNYDLRCTMASLHHVMLHLLRFTGWR